MTNARFSHGHRGLIAWQKAVDYADHVLSVCDGVPIRLGAGILPQLRRSVISIPSNIAEGYGRPIGEKVLYIRHSRGSLRESDTQLELLLRRGGLKTETMLALLEQADEIERLTYGLMTPANR